MDASTRTPVHLWVVGVLSALWNAIGASDYTLSQLRPEFFVSQMTSEQIAWLDAAPAIAHASWAFGVWGAFLGSLLLLARSRFAVWSFALSLAGLAVNTIYQFRNPMPGSHIDSPAMLALHGAIWATAIFLLVYAFRMRARGVLR